MDASTITPALVGLSLTVLLCVPGRGEEAACAEFTGTWKLDLSVSRSKELNRIMELFGLNWFERMLANQSGMEQTVLQDGTNRLDLALRSTFRNDEESLHCDGRWRPATDPAGNAVERRSCWREDGQAIVTNVRSADGREPVWEMTVTRWLAEDRNTMYIQTECIDPEGEHVTARRVFRRTK